MQVDGAIDQDAIQALRKGVELKDGMTKPAKVQIIEEPELWPRNPPIRYRANIPTSWIEVKISEFKWLKLRE